MIELTVNKKTGRYLVAIPDHRGITWLYEVEILGRGPRHFASRLHKQDGRGTVWGCSMAGGIWRCDCPAWLYRARWGRDTCKHCEHMAELAAVLAAAA